MAFTIRTVRKHRATIALSHTGRNPPSITLHHLRSHPLADSLAARRPSASPHTLDNAAGRKPLPAATGLKWRHPSRSIAATIASVVNGRSLTRTPTATASALPIAAAVGP